MYLDNVFKKSIFITQEGMYMEWTREMRYRSYGDWSAQTLLELQANALKSTFKLGYHIMPSSGLLNDPNGFSYYNGYWHVFYQAYPFGAVHGLKSWFHLRSKDLVNWEPLGLALKPDCKYDSHGAYSGSAKEVNGKLFIMYTGNERDENWVRHPHQLGAVMDENNQITKLPQPLIEQPKEVSEHFRDPQLIWHRDAYYVIIGAQDEATKKGKIILYKSKDLEKFTGIGYLDFTDQDMGYMIECPNLVFIDDQPVLLFCPQGMAQSACAYDDIYPNCYLVGDKVRLDAGKFESSHQIKNFDEGFDVYASQAFNAPDGKVYAISWVGLPDVDYPSDNEGWAHCLSQVKELTLKDGQLYLRPVKAMADLRYDGQPLTATPAIQQVQELVADSGNQYEVKLTLAANQQGTLNLAYDPQTKLSLKVIFDTEAGTLTLDRTDCGQSFATDYKTTRTAEIKPHAALDLDIFIDNSLCEIFVNGGQFTMTSRFFMEPGVRQINLKADQAVAFRGTFWKMRSI